MVWARKMRKIIGISTCISYLSLLTFGDLEYGWIFRILTSSLLGICFIYLWQYDKNIKEGKKHRAEMFKIFIHENRRNNR